MYKSEGLHWLKILWHQENSSLLSMQAEIINDNQRIEGGTFDIKIRVKSSAINVYINGCLKSEDEVDVIEALSQGIYAVHLHTSRIALDGELSNIRYFAIGDSHTVVKYVLVFVPVLLYLSVLLSLRFSRDKIGDN